MSHCTWCEQLLISTVNRNSVKLCLSPISDTLLRSTKKIVEYWVQAEPIEYVLRSLLHSLLVQRGFEEPFVISLVSDRLSKGSKTRPETFLLRTSHSKSAFQDISLEQTHVSVKFNTTKHTCHIQSMYKYVLVISNEKKILIKWVFFNCRIIKFVYIVKCVI